MCLNAGLAGLVGITAGCQAVDVIGSILIGIVSGIIVVVIVEVLDNKLHIDDPVGAVAVHLGNGVWGTIAAGLFATSTSANGVDGPIYALVHGTDFVEGLKVLGVQFLGEFCILAWTAGFMIATFEIIKHTIGLRASTEEEIKGLDVTEHGLTSAYADFLPAVEHLDYGDAIQVTGDTPVSEAVEVKVMPTVDNIKPTDNVITKIEIICKERMLEPLKDALMKVGITGMTVSHVMGCGVQKGQPEYYRGVKVEPTLLPKIQIDIVVGNVPVSDVVNTAKNVLYTGHIGDGKIFIYNVLDVIKVRTGEQGKAALLDVE